MSSEQSRVGDVKDPELERSDKKYTDRQWLRKEYVERGRLQKNIADECGVTGSTISNWLDRLDIEKRDPYAHEIDPYKNHKNKHRDEQWLRKQYVEKEKRMSEISEEFGLGINTIRRWLDRFDIPRREHPNEKYENKRYRDKEWLKQQHIHERRTMADIAEECGVTYATISRWLDRHGIEKKDYQHNKNTCDFNLSGKSHTEGYPNWTATGSKADVGYLTVHRLVAIADGADPHDVFERNEYQVHHRNGFKCDNRPQNLEVVDSRTHGRHHTPDAVKWTDDDLEYIVRCMMNPAKYIDPD